MASVCMNTDSVLCGFKLSEHIQYTHSLWGYGCQVTSHQFMSSYNSDLYAIFVSARNVINIVNNRNYDVIPCFIITVLNILKVDPL